MSELPAGVNIHDVLRLAARIEHEEGRSADAAYDAAIAVLAPGRGPLQLPPAAPLHITEQGCELVLRRGNRHWLTIHEHELARVVDAARKLLAKRRSVRKYVRRRIYTSRFP